MYTSANVLDCERNTWTIGTGNTISSVVESTGCCMQIQNFTISNPAEIQYNVSPKAAGCATGTTESASMKLIQKVGTGADQCLVIAICRPSRQGVLIMCRQQSPQSLLSILFSVLTNLIGLLVLPNFKLVNQANCVLQNNNCVL